jgi:hypothetical protein
MRELHGYEPASEVDNMRERYSAARYILHLKATFEGNFKGRGEWSRVIKAMSPDDAEVFWADFGELVEAGALVTVLDAEGREQVKASVLAKLDEYRELGEGLMRDLGVPPALMHKVIAQLTEAARAMVKIAHRAINPRKSSADEDA